MQGVDQLKESNSRTEAETLLTSQILVEVLCACVLNGKASVDFTAERATDWRPKYPFCVKMNPMRFTQ